MRFDLSEEQQMLQDTLRRFLADGPEDAWAGLVELGIAGALFAEEHGGFGGTGFDLTVVFEEIGRADLHVPLIDQALLPGLLMLSAGKDVEALMAGETRLAFAHSEVSARYDLSSVETRAEDNRLTGRKSVVAGGDTADLLVVSARSGGAVDDEDGIGLWTVAPDAPGVSVFSYEMIQGGHAAEVTLDNAPAEPLMPDGFPAIGAAMAAATLAQCAETLGSMEVAVHMTHEYLMTRKQFGRPIGTFQVLRHRLADLMLALEQARSAVIMAAAQLDAEPRVRDLHVSAAKNLLGRTGRLVAEETIQMHGGIGMTEEYALGRYAKRIAMADHRFGDTDHHLERFIALSS